VIGHLVRFQFQFVGTHLLPYPQSLPKTIEIAAVIKLIVSSIIAIDQLNRLN
jgi:hypothetical protein